MSNKLIYFKQYDTPKMVLDPFLKKEYPVSGEWVTDHPLIEKVLIYGHMSSKEPSEIKMSSTIIMKDGARKDTLKNTNDPYNYEEEERWLQENGYLVS